MKKNIRKIISQYPGIRIDKSLDKYDGIVLFPEKLAQANEALKKCPFPKELMVKSK